jgi:regulator of RNase E activity RraA
MRDRFHPVKFRSFPWSWAVSALLALTVCGLVWGGRTASAQQTTGPNYGDPLLEGFVHSTTSSVSDAEEDILGKKMYMSHKMRPLFPSRFAGYADTVLLKQQENTQGGAVLGGMLTAIDTGKPNSVYVMVVPNGANIAGIGGEMATTMQTRHFSGAVVDGGVRDTRHIRDIGFPVFSTTIVPSTSVKHYVFAGSNIPVVCDGVTVHPGDVIFAGADGVLVIPHARAAQVLALAQKMDYQEALIDAEVMKTGNIEAAVKKYNRL